MYTDKIKMKKVLGVPPETLPKNMVELFLDLSSLCREIGWHKSGVHLFVAAEELQNMIEKGEITQEMYHVAGRKM